VRPKGNVASMWSLCAVAAVRAGGRRASTDRGGGGGRSRGRGETGHPISVRHADLSSVSRGRRGRSRARGRRPPERVRRVGSCGGRYADVSCGPWWTVRASSRAGARAGGRGRRHVGVGREEHGAAGAVGEQLVVVLTAGRSDRRTPAVAVAASISAMAAAYQSGSRLCRPHR
jgi:hypothetical protein